MMPLLRSLVDATDVTSTNGPDIAPGKSKGKSHKAKESFDPCLLPFDLPATHQPAVCADNFYSRKDLILNQYNGRVQKPWPRSGPGHGDQPAVTVDEPHPFGRSGGPLDLLTARDAVPGLPRDDDSGKGSQQAVHREDGERRDAAAELFQSVRAVQGELAASGSPQRLQTRAGFRQLAQ